MTEAGRLFGRGISFPPRVGPDGRVAWSEGEQNIREAIRVILHDRAARARALPGVRRRAEPLPLRAEHRRPRASCVEDAIEQALARWEPRIDVESVDGRARPGRPQAAIATITYRLVATQARERVSLSVALAGRPDACRSTIPSIDDRRYQDLLEEALARIPIHNPEWTNFNDSDPGVTLIQLFAFLTESLLYRATRSPSATGASSCSCSACRCGRPPRRAGS